MLNQIGMTCAFLSGGFNQQVHGLQLVIARENQGFLGVRAHGLGLFDLHKATQNQQHTIALQHFFPQIAGAVAVRVGWVARRAVVAAIEGQKARVFAVKSGRHPDFFGADSEMHQCPLFELE